MEQRAFAQHLQEAYVNAISRMARHYRREPAEYSAAEVQAYLFHLVKDRMPRTHQG